MSDWISVNDDMPTEVDEYLITDGEIVTTLTWNGKCWFSDVFDSPVIQGYVAYWMPLPSPPNV